MPSYTVIPATRTTLTEVKQGWVVEKVVRGDKTYAATILYRTESEAQAQCAKLLKQEGNA